MQTIEEYQSGYINKNQFQIQEMSESNSTVIMKSKQLDQQMPLIHVVSLSNVKKSQEGVHFNETSNTSSFDQIPPNKMTFKRQREFEKMLKSKKNAKIKKEKHQIKIYENFQEDQNGGIKEIKVDQFIDGWDK